MFRPALVLLVAVWAGLCGLAPVRAAQPVFPAGSRIGLVLPPGDLEPSGHFPGFEDSAHKVSIALFDIPGRTYSGLEQSGFAGKIKGLAVEKRELFSFAGGLGFLITGETTVAGEKVRSWYLLANTMSPKAGRIAAFVRVHVPEKARTTYPDKAIRAALRSVTFRAPPLDAMLEHLPFKLKDMAGFRVMRVVPPATAVLIDGPENDPLKYPYMVVGMGGGAPRRPSDRARFARDLLSSAPVRIDKVTSAESLRLDNSPVFEVRADAKGPDGVPLALVQWLRFEGSAFVRIVGVVRKQDWNTLFPRFRAVRDGVSLH